MQMIKKNSFFYGLFVYIYFRYSRRYIEKLLAYAEALSVGCGNAVTVHIVPPKYKKPTVYKFQVILYSTLKYDIVFFYTFY